MRCLGMTDPLPKASPWLTFLNGPTPLPSFLMSCSSYRPLCFKMDFKIAIFINLRPLVGTTCLSFGYRNRTGALRPTDTSRGRQSYHMRQRHSMREPATCDLRPTIFLKFKTRKRAHSPLETTWRQYATERARPTQRPIRPQHRTERRRPLQSFPPCTRCACPKVHPAGIKLRERTLVEIRNGI